MPQMAPINWLSLYFLFILVYLIFMVTNYYSFIYTPKIIKTQKTMNTLTWKW
uniref:ATP synthase complex subunit 8 n=1 Tax=Strophosoma melanogrammum TaxID=202215 RepID=J9PH00_STRME|nr:ATP synthase F0 subunit 8 [Strophosoma melanogrammum]